MAQVVDHYAQKEKKEENMGKVKKVFRKDHEWYGLSETQIIEWIDAHIDDFAIDCIHGGYFNSVKGENYLFGLGYDFDNPKSDASFDAECAALDDAADTVSAATELWSLSPVHCPGYEDGMVASMVANGLYCKVFVPFGKITHKSNLFVSIHESDRC